MDPIEYLKLYMTMWEQWLQKYETYKYHGDIMRCKKGIALIPIYKGSLKEKHPPIYYQYNYTGYEEFGFAKFSLFRNRADMLVWGGNCLYYRSFGIRLPYDALVLTLTNPRCDGSISADVAFENITCGVYKELSLYQCWYMLGWALQSPFPTLGDQYSKWYASYKPLYIDYWWWRFEPASWTYSYTFSWRYYPITKKYDYWDSAGRSAFGVSERNFTFHFSGVRGSWSSGNCGKCGGYLGVVWSNIAVYSGIYTPPP